MSSHYGYINARIKGLKSHLLDSDFYTNAIATSNFQAFSSALSQAQGYTSDMEEASSQYQGLQMVDSAIGRNFYNTTRRVLNLASGSPAKLIEVMLLRYDLHNLKTIARAKLSGRSAADIRQSLFPAGRLKPATLEHITDTNDITSAAQAISMTRHPLSSTFNRAVSQYSEGQLFDIELALDKAYFKALFAELQGVDYPAAFKRHLQREVDCTNVLTALKVKDPTKADSLFIKGGREIGRSTFDSLMQGNSSVLANGKFAAIAEANSLSQAEEGVSALLNESAKRLSNASPLDIGPVLHFFRLKEAESSKLRLLARGKYYGVSQERLAKEFADG